MTSLGRLLILPFKLLQALFETIVQVGRAIGRLLGARGVIGLLVGSALGLLFAPGPGRDLRDRLRALQASRGGVSDADLAQRVVFELEHAPRTWHLDQPTVTVVSGRVILSGLIAQVEARDELGRVAAAVPGVIAVDNLLEVDDPADRAMADPD